jgi:hypothetical protein
LCSDEYYAMNKVLFSCNNFRKKHVFYQLALTKSMTEVIVPPSWDSSNTPLVAGNLLLAYGAHSSVEWELIKKLYVFSAIFGHFWSQVGGYGTV